MITLVTVLLLLFSIACMFRLAFLIPAMLLVGFLADPLRKLVEGEPVYFVVFVGVAVLSAFIGLFFRNGLSIFEALTRWSPKVRLPLTLFMVLIFIQAMNSFIGYGSLILTGIGAMSYTAPFLAMVVGYFVFDRNERIQQLIKAYLICGALLVAAVCLSFLGLDWAVLKEVGAGLVIYDQGTIVYSHSGFMRSSEIAAWHMATAVCFLIILNVTNRSRLTIPASVVFGLILFVGVVLTGRRKMIMQIVQFCGLYGVLYFYFKRSLSLLIMLLLAFSIFALWLGIELLFPGGYSDSFGIYVARGTSVFGDALDRAYGLGLMPISWAYNRVGLFGGGVGIGSQGVYHFTDVVAGYAGPAEGGLGKIMLELGIFGFILLIWLALAFLGFFARVIRFSVASKSGNSSMVIGVYAFVLSNIPTFVVASALFGDLFVLSLLGLMASYLLASPTLIVRGKPTLTNGQGAALN